MLEYGKNSAPINIASYFKNPGNLLLSINVDWFQPFVHTNYSVGALYLVILHLPREVRYKIENIILVDVIPGPKEPQLLMNSYITPLVQELTAAYQGWIIPTKHTIKNLYAYDFALAVLSVIYQLLENYADFLIIQHNWDAVSA